MKHFIRYDIFTKKDLKEIVKYTTIFLMSLLAVAAVEGQNPFITTWKTDNRGVSNASSISIPTHPGHTYRYDVDWENDGIFDDIDVTGSITHDYLRSDTYEVAIRGTFPRIFFDNGGDRQKILEIRQWGDIAWENMNSAFDGCENLIETASDAPDLTNVASMSEMFRRATHFTGDLSNWDVSNVPWMVSTFQDATAFNGDISSWNVSNVNSIRFMFDGASSFNQDISGWNVSNMTDFQRTFRDASAFDQDLGDWDINQVTDMTEMFDNSGMSRKNYDRTLISWAIQNGLQSGVALGANGLKYCNAAGYRDQLIGAPYNWVINGDNEDCTDAVFLTTWQTDIPGESNNSSISIEKNAFLGDYYYDVDWDNDGNYDTLGVTDDIMHEYSSPGIYQVAIRGRFPGIRFGIFNNDGNKLLSIDQWGEIEWKSFSNAFADCDNLRLLATDTPDLSHVSSCASMFEDCVLINFDLNSWDVSNITDMSSMFAGASVFNQPLNDWDVSNVTDMRSMFARASVFNQPLNNWDVSNVTDMSGMFRSASNFNQPLPTWNVGNVQDMCSMFRNAISFNQPIDSWDVSNVTDMRWMFNGAGVFNQLLNNWDVSNVTSMVSMFQGASEFNQPLNNWDVSNVTSMIYMFAGASEFNQPLNNWDVSNVTDMRWMFNGAGVFNQLLNNWDVSNLTSMVSMFDGASVFNQPLNNWDVRNVTDMRRMFDGASEFDQLLNNWDVSNVTDMFGMFAGASVFNQPLNDWDVSNVTDMSFMFDGANVFNQPLHNWDVSNVTLMAWMFAGASEFDQLLNNWDVSNVTDMRRMFNRASVFNQPLNNWDVSNVTDVRSMFQDAYHFDQDLGSWNIGAVVLMSDMLNNSGLRATNYDNTLLGWAQQNVQPNVSLGADNLLYCNGVFARNMLISAPNNWTITGDTEDCDNILPCTSSTTNTWINPLFGTWQGNGADWSQSSVPSLCDDVVTKVGVLITVIPGPKARCHTLEVLPGSLLEVEAGGVLEVWAGNE